MGDVPMVERVAQALDDAPEIVLRKNKGRSDGLLWEVCLFDRDVPISDGSITILFAGSYEHAQRERVKAERSYLARAAIAALREPTEAMLEAASIAIAPDDPADEAAARLVETLWGQAMIAFWKAMVDAALTGSRCPSASEARPPTSEP